MKTRVNKVTTPKKNIRVPVARKHISLKVPRKYSQPQPEQQMAKTNDITKEEQDSIIEWNDRVEDQHEAEKLRLYLNREFPDVLKEQLEKEDRMNVNLAELVMLNEDVDPHYRGWAREVPVHYIDEAKQLIADLLEAGIISEVTRPVEWCTQGFLVPKPSTGKLRLVTNYRNLKKA